MPSLLPPVSDSDLARIHSASERVLAETGFRVGSPRLRDHCRSAGAQVDDASRVVRFPPELLGALLAQAPSQFAVSGVDGTRWTLGGGEQHCLAIVTDPWIVDYGTREPRRPRLEDLRRHTIIANALPRVFAVSRMDFPVEDYPGPHSSLRALQEHLRYHRKHVYILPADVASFRDWLELGEIMTCGSLAGSGLFTLGAAVLSPLALSELNCDLLMLACQYGFAVVPTVCPQAGSTAPYSLAGTLLQANVENLAVVALTQIVAPGNPAIYAVGPSVADMRSGHDRYYTLD